MGVQGLEFGGNEKKYLILNLKTIKKDLWNANREFTGMTRRRNRWQRGWTVNSLLYPRDQRHPKRKAEDTDEWVKSVQSPWDLPPLPRKQSHSTMSVSPSPLGKVLLFPTFLISGDFGWDINLYVLFGDTLSERECLWVAASLTQVARDKIRTHMLLILFYL